MTKHIKIQESNCYEAAEYIARSWDLAEYINEYDDCEYTELFQDLLDELDLFDDFGKVDPVLEDIVSEVAVVVLDQYYDSIN
jgi:hypothetical protein